MKQLNKKAKWFFFFQYLIVFFFIVGFGFSGLLGLIVESTEAGQIKFDGTAVTWGLLGLVVWIILSYLAAWLTWLNYRYEVAADGFKKESGVIWKRYVTIPYSRIQNVDIHRGVFARILGLSDLQVQTAGNSNQYGLSEGRLPGIDKNEAEALRNELIRRVSEPAGKQGI